MRALLSTLLVIVCVLQVLLGISFVAGSWILSQKLEEPRQAAPPEQVRQALQAVRNEDEVLDREKRRALIEWIESDEQVIRTLERAMHEASADLLPVNSFLLLPGLLSIGLFVARKPQSRAEPSPAPGPGSAPG